MVQYQVADDARLDLDFLDVVFQHDFVAGVDFAFAHHVVPLKYLDRLFLDVKIHRFGRGSHVFHAAFFGFLLPFVRIAVAFEQHVFGSLDVFAHHVHNRHFLLFALVNQRIGLFLELNQRVGHNRVQHRHGVGAIGGTTHGTELKLVAREGKRRGAVAVGVVQQNRRNLVNAELHVHIVALVELDIAAFLQFIEHAGHLRTDENGNDGRWRFVGTEAVFVARRTDGSPHQIGIIVYGFHHIHKKSQEAQVFLGAAARPQQVHARVRAQRPVVVLARSVDARKWFFVEQHLEIVPLRHFLHHVHHQQVVIHG